MNHYILIFTVLAAIAFCVILIYWLEHHFLRATQLRLGDRIQLWVLRFAGIWVLFWFLWPTVTLAQNTRTTQELIQRDVSINNQRIISVEARVATLEALRLDARLSLLEDTNKDVKAMRQWVFGIFGSVLMLLLTQIISVRNRGDNRK